MTLLTLSKHNYAVVKSDGLRNIVLTHIAEQNNLSTYTHYLALSCDIIIFEKVKNTNAKNIFIYNEAPHQWKQAERSINLASGLTNKIIKNLTLNKCCCYS